MAALPGQPPYRHYGAQDLDQDLRRSRMFWEGDVQHTATIFRFDGLRSQVDEVYGETLGEEKVFFDPVEVTVVPEIGELTNKFKVPGGLAQQENRVVLAFYLAELQTKDCRPHTGDFVLWREKFYEMGPVDEILDSNTHAGIAFYVGAVCNLVSASAIPPGLANWKF